MLTPLLGTFINIAYQTGINTALLYSICTVETGLRNINNYEDNNESSYGMCQVQLSTARDLLKHVDSLALQQPEVNIKVAALYLQRLKYTYNDNLWHLASAYNAGSVRIIDGEYANKNYVDKVKSVYYNLIEDKGGK